MSDPRNDPKVRGWSLLLSSLALTPDVGLGSFRDRRAGDPKLDLEKLKVARGVLDAVAQAIESKDPGRWHRLERAFALLERDALLPLDQADGGKDTSSAIPAKQTTSPNAPAPSAEPASTMEQASQEQAPALVAAPTPINTYALGGFVNPAAAVTPAGVPQPPRVFAPSALAVSPPPLAVPPPVSKKPVPSPIDINQAGGAGGDRTVLPFTGGPGVPPPMAADEPHSDVGSTATVDAVVIDDALPFVSEEDTVRAPAAIALSLVLQPYASFCVERELYAGRISEVRARYGIADLATETTLDQKWQTVLGADATLRADFDAKCKSYREWLLSRR
jgi:hypothetical protein